jgi:micrococcal nuclease
MTAYNRQEARIDPLTERWVVGPSRRRVASYVAVALVVGFALGMATSQLMSRRPRVIEAALPAAPPAGANPAASAQAESTTPAAPGPAAKSGKVTRMIRADVVEVEGIGPVRMIGIETPDGKPPTAVYGAVGQRALKTSEAMLLNQVVRVEFDPANSSRDHKDEAGYTLAYLYTADGALVNGELIKQGLAYLRSAEKFRMSEDFNSMEREAMQALRGVWGTGLTGSSAAAEFAANDPKPGERRRLTPLPPSAIGPNIPAASTSSVPSPSAEPVVLLSGDRRYHNRHNCELLDARKQSATASAARAQGYTPCSRCYPSATIKVR